MRVPVAALGGDATAAPDGIGGVATDSKEPSGAELRTRRIALFIDLKNVQLHLERIHETISVERIRAALRDFGELRFLFAYTDATRAPFELLRDIDHWGVHVVNCPMGIGTDGRPSDTVDAHMQEAIRSFLDGTVDVIAIATNDNDFIRVIHEAKQRQCEVILLVGEPDASLELQRIADHVRFIGSPFLREFTAFVRMVHDAGDGAEAHAGIAAAQEQYPDVARVCAELLTLVGREQHGMPAKLLRDRCWQNPTTWSPTVAFPEDGLVCIRVFQELGCLVLKPETAEDRRRNLLLLNRAHPLVQFLLDPTSSRAHTDT